MFAGLGKSGCCTYKLHQLFMDLRVCICARSSQSQPTSVDGKDIKAFAKLSPNWTKEEGSFKALYAMNRLRLPLIVDTIGRETEQSDVIFPTSNIKFFLVFYFHCFIYDSILILVLLYFFRRNFNVLVSSLRFTHC